MREDIKEVRAEQHALASLVGKVTDAVTAIAQTQDHHSQVLARHSAILEHHARAPKIAALDLAT